MVLYVIAVCAGFIAEPARIFKHNGVQNLTKHLRNVILPSGRISAGTRCKVTFATRFDQQHRPAKTHTIRILFQIPYCVLGLWLKLIPRMRQSVNLDLHLFAIS